MGLFNKTNFSLARVLVVFLTAVSSHILQFIFVVKMGFIALAVGFFSFLGSCEKAFAVENNQCFVDYYDPGAEDFSKNLCVVAGSRAPASVTGKISKQLRGSKKLKFKNKKDRLKAIQDELSKNLHAADINFDGKPDFFRKYKNGKLVSISYDASGDGKIDFEYVLNNKEVIFQEKMDRNLDGKWDFIKHYKKHANFTITVDTDYDGNFDEVHFYTRNKKNYTKTIKKITRKLKAVDSTNNQQRTIASQQDEEELNTISWDDPNLKFIPASKKQMLIKPIKSFPLYKDAIFVSEAGFCTDDCYARKTENYFYEEGYDILEKIHGDEFEFKLEGDFFKSMGMLIHESCLDEERKENETNKDVAARINDLLVELTIDITDCYDRLMQKDLKRNGNKIRANAVNTGHFPNLLRTLGVTDNNGKPVFGKYPDYIKEILENKNISAVEKQELNNCLQSKNSAKTDTKEKCYLQNETKILCGDTMNNKDIAVGTVFSTLLYEDLYGLSWKGKRLKVSHPMIHFRRGRSIFDKYVLFREIQRNMGYSNDLNIMNAYVQTCQNACFQNEFDKFKKGYIDLADELCMAEPNAHESCNYFLKLSKLLNMNGEWGNLFGTKARPITGTDHVTHQTHIAFVCKDTPGAFEEIYEFAPNSPESSVFDFKNKEKNQ